MVVNEWDAHLKGEGGPGASTRRTVAVAPSLLVAGSARSSVESGFK